MERVGTEAPSKSEGTRRLQMHGRPDQEPFADLERAIPGYPTDVYAMCMYINIQHMQHYSHYTSLQRTSIGPPNRSPHMPLKPRVAFWRSAEDRCIFINPD